MHVHDALAVAEVERLELAGRQHRLHERAIVARASRADADGSRPRARPASPRRRPRQPSVRVARRSTSRKRPKNFAGSGRRLTARKSIAWMKQPRPSAAMLAHRRRPAVADRAGSGRRRCAAAARWPRRGCRWPRPPAPRAGRRRSAHTTRGPRGVTTPSSVARHGTIAGTQVRSATVSGADARGREPARARRLLRRRPARGRRPVRGS